MPVEIAVALITGGVTLANILLSALINYLGRREQRKERSKDIEQQEFDNLKEKVDDIADGMQSLLRNEIIHTHEKWKDRHYCPV